MFPKAKQMPRRFGDFRDPTRERWKDKLSRC
jgi:hypothetical protein